MFENINLSEDNDPKSLKRKLHVTVGLLFAILFVKLLTLQLAGYQTYYSEAENQRTRPVNLDAPRGFIYDRNNTVLVDNRPSYTITFDPLSGGDPAKVVDILGTLTGIDTDKILQRIMNERNRNIGSWARIKVIIDADFGLVSIIEEYSDDLPGFAYQMDTRRRYPNRKLLSHVLGYMGEITEEEYEQNNDVYSYGQLVGRQGIELQYESILRGTNGVKFVEVDARAREIGLLEDIEPILAIPGQDITLTIDTRLQRIAENSFRDSLTGSIVALDPRNGEILVLASLPGFDPNVFTTIGSHKKRTDLLTDESKPLFNRAVAGTYPPGSTLKMLTAIGGLETQCFVESNFQPCRGTYRYGRKVHRCWIWERGGHGRLNLHDAIVQSCDIYFYQLGARLKLDPWNLYGQMLGLGEPTGIDLPGESAGLLPDLEFYNQPGRKEGYAPGMMLNLAIGQGEVLLTPLQMASYVGIIATKGHHPVPHLLKYSGNHTISEFDSQHKTVTGISQETFDFIREAMLDVVESPRGTARASRLRNVHYGGKTGTAQNPLGEDHAWFVAFAPYTDPTVVVVCIVENAGHGASVAAPIVKRFLEEYFALEYQVALSE